jgi:RHS repeat-associated protein
MTYDGDAQRAKKSGPNGTTYYFSNEFEKIGDTETCYIFAGNLRVAMVKDHTNVTYFHKDHLGSSSVITAANGNAQEQTRYLPFGGQRGEGAGITASNYLFTDQELDAESGLYNYDARLYDPNIGRFFSADSVVPDSYDPQALNGYAYVQNNPLIYVDPSGHTDENVVVKVTGMTVTARQPDFFNSLGEPGFITSWGGAVTIFTPGNTIQQPGWSCPPAIGLSEPIMAPWEIIGLGYAVGSGVVKYGVTGTFKFVSKRAAKSGLKFGQLRKAVKTAAEPYKGSTKLGHALHKHSGRNPSLWGKIKGNMKTWHEQGMTHFREIHKAPGSYQKVTDPKTGLTFLEKRLPDGRGIRLQMDHTFKGFID